jgi:hypothetical protein
MKSHILFLFLFFTGFANAQKPELNYAKLSRNDWSSIMKGNQPLMTKKSDDVELRGTPFVYDTYEKGVVIVSDSLHSQNEFKFKLNAEDNEIWIMNEKNEELVLTDKRITGLDLIVANDTHSFRKVILPDVKTNPNRFVEVLYGGTNFTLIKHTEKLFEAANAVDKGVAIIGRNYDSYITTISYYILTSKKVFKKIALKTSDIYKADLALVEKNRDAINAFCKEQKISNPLEEDDAADLVEFIDKLK